MLSKLSINSALIVAAFAGLSTAASAQSQAPQGSVCPAGYEPLYAYCYDGKTGDVVMAEALTAARIASSTMCRQGYPILHQSLCYSEATGDVEMAQDGVANGDFRAANLQK
jgi:hypothetical protein